MDEIISNALKGHKAVVSFIEANRSTIINIASFFIQTLRAGGKIIFFGNGGSAADAQHLAAELVGRFKKNRQALASIALNTNTSIITALGNDFGFDSIFSKQIEALAKPEDTAVGLSTSGESDNVIKAMIKAKEIKLKTIGLLGKDGGKLKEIVDLPMIIPSRDTERIQEAHIVIGHMVCEIVENEIFT